MAKFWSQKNIANLFGLKILDIYIIKKFLGTFFFSILLIISIAVVFDLSEKLDDFMENNAPTHAIIYDYYLNFIPYFANLFSYLFTFIAVIYFTSKMAYNTEVIAILSNGVSFRRMMLPYFISATLIAGFSFVLTNYVIPHANAERFAFEEQYYHDRSVTYDERNIHKQLQPGVYVYMDNYSNRSNIGYKFSIEEFDQGKLKSKLLAEYIRWDSTINKWRIHNYYIREINGLEEEIIEGSRIDTSLNMHPNDFKRRDNVVEAMNLGELNDFIAELKLQGSTNIEHVQIEKGKRFAYPFSCFILTLLGVSVSSRKVRGGMGGHLGIGVGLSFSYILFLQFSSQFAISGLMSPYLAVWVPNILFLIVGLVLYRLAPK
jgi:lipopolysaccharide export system permease protein